MRELTKNELKYVVGGESSVYSTATVQHTPSQKPSGSLGAGFSTTNTKGTTFSGEATVTKQPGSKAVTKGTFTVTHKFP